MTNKKIFYTNVIYTDSLGSWLPIELVGRYLKDRYTHVCIDGAIREVEFIIAPDETRLIKIGQEVDCDYE